MSDFRFYQEPRTTRWEFTGGVLTGAVIKKMDAEERGTVNQGDPVARIVDIRMENEVEAKGGTAIRVSVLDESGRATNAQVRMVWPTHRYLSNGQMDGSSTDTARPTKYAEFWMGPNSFKPTPGSTEVGPYVIEIVSGPEGQVMKTDLAVGFGLPANRHWNGYVTFRLGRAYTVDRADKMPGVPSDIS